MKKNIIIMSFIVVGITLWAFYLYNASYPDYSLSPQQNDSITNNDVILTTEEIDWLLLMREEEKLARDVYNALFTKWWINIFNNIANSENTHTSAIKQLLDRYNIEDPVKDDSPGIFTSVELQNLYNSLITKGEQSVLDALIVWATIEDLDIKDLTELTQQTTKEDIIMTYNNLNRGSRNHLRSFVQQIESRSGSYSAQYISPTELDTILSSAQERGWR
jgi:hypothetical protein